MVARNSKIRDILNRIENGESPQEIAKAVVVSKGYVYRLSRITVGPKQRRVQADRLVNEYIQDVTSKTGVHKEISHDQFLNDIARITLNAEEKAAAMADARIAKAAYYFREYVEAASEEEVQDIMDSVGGFWLPDIFFRERESVNVSIPKIVS